LIDWRGAIAAIAVLICGANERPPGGNESRPMASAIESKNRVRCALESFQRSIKLSHAAIVKFYRLALKIR
jgi:hypothetical protein